ncbi:ribose-phosphate pyrophosphokinase-like domain-containing protein, partial [Bacillus cereus]
MSNEYGDKNLKIVSFNSNPELAKEIADNVGFQLGKCSVTRIS